MTRQDLADAVNAKREDDPYEIFRWSMVSPHHKYLWIILPKNACVITTHHESKKKKKKTETHH